MRLLQSLPFVALAALASPFAGSAADPAVRPRARALGIPFEGTPGPLDAITDVAGVEVGQVTLISGEGPLVVGKGPVRTGVTAILPRGRASDDPVFAGTFTLNGNGEMTGLAWLRESGFLEGQLLITNTYSVGVARDALIDWQARRDPGASEVWGLPVVAETYDGWLNDILGFHVKPQHVFEALDKARSGPVAEGSVGGGTGMICFEWKCGIGTASRRVKVGAAGYVVGVLVQANFGFRPQALVAGVPVGREIRDGTFRTKENGSIIIVVATDAPLLPHQLDRVARRAGMGLARTGSTAGDGSGDIFLAFSTANPGVQKARAAVAAQFLPNDTLNPVFDATVQATEEAIVNALVAGETMTGVDGHRVLGIPHDRLRDVLRKYGRLEERDR